MKSHTRRLLVDYRERILFPFQGSSATCLNWNSMPQQFEVPTSPQLGWFLTNGFAWVCHVFFQGTCRNESTFMSLSRLKAMNMGLPVVSKWSRMVSIFLVAPLPPLPCRAEGSWARCSMSTDNIIEAAMMFKIWGQTTSDGFLVREDSPALGVYYIGMTRRIQPSLATAPLWPMSVS